ncbi:MAG: rhomboid family intramembrane serine protease [Candidatus Omnitrophica bacterium]|nr:rhomboid family intramembrane serine protease [Candidatus Omnitrophota bacterium]
MGRLYYDTRPSIGFGGPITYAVKWLIILNAGIFVLQITLGRIYPSLLNIFALVPNSLFNKWMIWQLGTYMFLHGDIFHLAFNMLGLYFFGADLERAWGRRAFISYYLWTGIGAGLTTYLTAMNSNVPTIGASGAIFGILLAFGMLFPNRPIMLLLFFFIPVTMLAKYLVIVYGILELIMSLQWTPDGIAHFAHLGGMVFGWLYLKNQDRARFAVHSWKINLQKQKTLRQKKDRDKRETFISEQVDPILDKISREGLHSLSKSEKNILKKAKEYL